MKKKLLRLLFILVCILCSAISLQATVSICNLQVEYQTNPLGIDITHPRFNWQMASEHSGMMQTAYRLVLAGGPEALSAGNYLFDTGKVLSDESVGIRYNGKTLQPSTRYYWRVTVWDNQQNEWKSAETAWFEMALPDNGWDHAQWIGSSKVQLSKYRTHYVIDYDVEIPEGSNRAVFVWGARDAVNFVSAELNVDDAGKTLFILSHTTDGVESQDAIVDVSDIIPIADRHKKHHIKIDVSVAQYARMYYADISIDGKTLVDPSLSDEELKRKSTPGFFGVKEGMFIINPFPEGELSYLCRLYAIGFNQPEGEKARFSNLKISEKVWNTRLYQSVEIYNETGNGKPNVWFPGEGVSAPMLRKSLNLNKPVKSARLYATARGIYEFTINGERVGKDYFNPGWTDYRYRIMYNTYDITPMLQEGENAIGAMLGTGWWSDQNGFSTGWQDQYGIRQSLLAKIDIRYTDGSEETIVTDGSWKCYDNGPVTVNGFQNGEDYDARKEVEGWDRKEFDDSRWSNVDIFSALPEGVKLQPYVGSPIRNNITLTAQSMVEALPGVYVYDMGQNMVGVPRLTMKGNKGQEITIRFGEMNYPDVIPTDPVAPYTTEIYRRKKGQVYTDNYRSALSTDRYIMKGDPNGETYEPRFTFHGYRYIEIHGLSEPLALEDVKGLVLESVGEQTSSYETSDERINKLYSNIVWGQRGNFLSVPTDCPQRDERMGWTGDAQVFARTATYNMNVNPFYTRWLYSIRDNQGPDGRYANFVPVLGTPPQGANPGGGAMGWMEAGVIVPWQLYQQYNDVGILEQHYASMLAYMDFLESRAVNFIQPFGGFGDHLAIEPTNSMLTNTAYAAYDALIMEQIAKRLGKEADRQRFRAFYENIKSSFNEVFVDANGRTFAPAANSIFPESQGRAMPGASSANEAKVVDTQTSYIVPLQFGLFNETNKPLALKHLVDNIEKHGNTLTTGFIGTPYLNLVLSDNGLDDVAYRLFEQTAFPSWLYPVSQGATTIWERWNSYTIVNGFGPVDMNSFNHYSYGAIQEWMMAYTLGIQRDEQQPGYKHIMLQPRIGGSCTFIRGHYDSVYGRIESGWEKQNNSYTYQATVPANTTATLYLPVSDVNQVRIDKGEEGTTFLRYENGKAVYRLVSGTYRITVTTDS